MSEEGVRGDALVRGVYRERRGVYRVVCVCVCIEDVCVACELVVFHLVCDYACVARSDHSFIMHASLCGVL